MIYGPLEIVVVSILVQATTSFYQGGSEYTKGRMPNERILGKLVDESIWVGCNIHDEMFT